MNKNERVVGEFNESQIGIGTYINETGSYKKISKISSSVALAILVEIFEGKLPENVFLEINGRRVMYNKYFISFQFEELSPRMAIYYHDGKFYLYREIN